MSVRSACLTYVVELERPEDCGFSLPPRSLFA
jgi:hypothetical protein